MDETRTDQEITEGQPSSESNIEPQAAQSPIDLPQVEEESVSEISEEQEDSPEPEEEAEAQADEQEKAEEEAENPPKPKKKFGAKQVFILIIRIIKIAIIVAIVAVLLFFVGFCVDKWMPNDDTSKIQGYWTVEPTTGNIQITDTKFVLDKSTNYDYSMNTVDKSIVCSLNDYKGACKYRFSKDDNTLIIIDGQIPFTQSFAAEVEWFYNKNIGCYFTEDQQPDIYIGYEENKQNNQIVTLKRVQPAS